MEGNFEWNKVVFYDSLEYDRLAQYADHILHILCIGGNMSFTFQDVRYNVVPGDYVIVTNPTLASGFFASDDFDAVIVSLSDSFITSMAIQSNYGIIGHLSLLQNPIMKLSQHDFRICLEDLWRLRERLNETQHLFREEMVGHLLLAHILDLYDIHARNMAGRDVSERNADLLRRFVELLYHKEYLKNRNLSHYASQLCITPHYLSEVCRKISGKPASYWIDRFTMQEITRLLRQKELSLTEISERMNFSSVSYFSRYVQKRLGVCPTEYKNSILKTKQS